MILVREKGDEIGAAAADVGDREVVLLQDDERVGVRLERLGGDDF